MSAKDPLRVKYDVQRHHCLGHGADGGVVRGVVLAGPQKGRWVALKYLSTGGFSPDREVKLWRQLKHPNILELLVVCPAYQAAATARARHARGRLRLAQFIGPFSAIPCRTAGGGEYQVVC